MSNELLFSDQNIVIVGVGLIGGSLGLACKQLGIGNKIIGVSRPDTLEAAKAIGVIDEGYDYSSLENGVSNGGLVFLCTPILRILELLPPVLMAAPAGAIVSDVGSTKREIVARATSVGREDVFFVGGHPMAGSEHSGVSAADPFLFQNAIYVITPTPAVPPEIGGRLLALVKALGAMPMEMAPDAHDRAAAAVSHLPQMMATTLVGMVGRIKEREGLPMQMAAGGFRDLTRIASSPFDMWRDICQTNAGQIIEMIDLFLEEMSSVRKTIDGEELGSHFEYANEVRGRIPKDSKGFLHPLFEVLLVVEDQPGVIARVSNLLANARINIDDIEVLKVREGEGGTIRLGFDTQQIAQEAFSILENAGVKVRLRQ